jgi:hypothetical protein
VLENLERRVQLLARVGHPSVAAQSLAEGQLEAGQLEGPAARYGQFERPDKEVAGGRVGARDRLGARD